MVPYRYAVGIAEVSLKQVGGGRQTKGTPNAVFLKG